MTWGPVRRRQPTPPGVRPADRGVRHPRRQRSDRDHRPSGRRVSRGSRRMRDRTPSDEKESRATREGFSQGAGHHQGVGAQTRKTRTRSQKPREHGDLRTFSGQTHPNGGEVQSWEHPGRGDGLPDGEDGTTRRSTRPRTAPETGHLSTPEGRRRHDPHDSRKRNEDLHKRAEGADLLLGLDRCPPKGPSSQERGPRIRGRGTTDPTETNTRRNVLRPHKPLRFFGNGLAFSRDRLTVEINK